MSSMPSVESLAEAVAEIEAGVVHRSGSPASNGRLKCLGREQNRLRKEAVNESDEEI